MDKKSRSSNSNINHNNSRNSTNNMDNNSITDNHIYTNSPSDEGLYEDLDHLLQCSSNNSNYSSGVIPTYAQYTANISDSSPLMSSSLSRRQQPQQQQLLQNNSINGIGTINNVNNITAPSSSSSSNAINDNLQNHLQNLQQFEQQHKIQMMQQYHLQQIEQQQQQLQMMQQYHLQQQQREYQNIQRQQQQHQEQEQQQLALLEHQKRLLLQPSSSYTACQAAPTQAQTQVRGNCTVNAIDVNDIDLDERQQMILSQAARADQISQTQRHLLNSMHQQQSQLKAQDGDGKLNVVNFDMIGTATVDNHQQYQKYQQHPLSRTRSTSRLRQETTSPSTLVRNGTRRQKANQAPSFNTEEIQENAPFSTLRLDRSRDSISDMSTMSTGVDMDQTILNTAQQQRQQQEQLPHHQHHSLTMTNRPYS